MDKNVAAFYPNSLCFEDKKQISFLSNWFTGKYENMWISFDMCRNTTSNPTKCAPIEEILEFTHHNIFYIIT